MSRRRNAAAQALYEQLTRDIAVATRQVADADARYQAAMARYPDPTWVPRQVLQNMPELKALNQVRRELTALQATKQNFMKASELLFFLSHHLYIYVNLA
jgi:predicted Zn-dependent protease